MSSLRAALNLARLHGHVATDQAWRVSTCARPRTPTGAATCTSTRTQRRALIAEGARATSRRCCAPWPSSRCAPGAVAALTVEAFDERLGHAHDRQGQVRARPQDRPSRGDGEVLRRTRERQEVRRPAGCARGRDRVEQGRMEEAAEAGRGRRRPAGRDGRLRAAPLGHHRPASPCTISTR
ncbi:MAG: hypothetical protein MZW92_80820 [Comamonadaceae bacterium]|nr:hypothetical protein [Comamonadaceae bacterium]